MVSDVVKIVANATFHNFCFCYKLINNSATFGPVGSKAVKTKHFRMQNVVMLPSSLVTPLIMVGNENLAVTEERNCRIN